ncbi:MAG: riboflavin synthase [bacterium]
MFTGIVEEIGQLAAVKKRTESMQLVIKGSKVLEGINIGDSIAVNGICLTVTSYTADTFTVDVMPETYRRTTLYLQSVGSMVNLERALTLETRLGGHLVSGHVDGIGSIHSIKAEENALLVRIKTEPDILYYIVPKGSITIEGISLTVVAADEISFTVSLIPHTAKETTLGYKKNGDKVNLEVDIIARYLAKFVKFSASNSSGSLTKEFLLENGFL